MIIFVQSNRPGREYFMIWKRTDLVGVLDNGMYIMDKVPTGKHQYVAKYGTKWCLLNTDLAAGHTYVVRVNLVPHGPIRFDPWTSPQVNLGILNDFQLSVPGKDVDILRTKYGESILRLFKKFDAGEIMASRTLTPQQHIN